MPDVGGIEALIQIQECDTDANVHVGVLHQTRVRIRSLPKSTER